MVSTIDRIREGVEDLHDAGLVERYRAAELEMRRLEAEMAVVIAEVDRRKVYLDDGHRSVAGWLRANGNLAGRQIRPRLHLAALVDALPAVIDRLADGHIGVAQAQQLGAVSANPRCGHQLGASIEVLLEQAEQLSFDDAKRCLDRWVMFADLDGAHRHREIDHERRTADVLEIDGSLHVAASGGTPLVAAEMQAIFSGFVDAEFDADAAERLAQHGPDAPASALPRTDPQRRYDALVAIFRAAAASTAPGSSPQLTINLLTDERTFNEALAADGLVPRLAADPHAPDWSERHCETVDGTVVHPTDIVRAAVHGYVRRVVVNAAGIPVDVGRRRRLFTGVARDVARLLGHHCDHPGCNVDASKCDIDHLAEWVRDGGATDLDNAGLRCNADNRAKRRLGFEVTRDARGRPRTRRPDGTWMHPVGQRQLHLEPDPPPEPADPADPADSADPTDRVDHAKPSLDDAELCRLARARVAALVS